MAVTAAAATRAPEAPRLRPGERPIWWNAEVDSDQFSNWRSAALAHGVGVDSAIAVLIEFDLVAGDLSAVTDRPLVTLSEMLDADHVAMSRVGGRAPWREWLSGGAAYEHDELPELVLPERLVARLTPGARLTERIQLGRLELAIECDRLAALYGRTLESWALSAMLTCVRAGGMRQPAA